MQFWELRSKDPEYGHDNRARRLAQTFTVLVIGYSKDVEKPVLMHPYESTFMNGIEFQSFLYVNIPGYEL